VSLFRLLSPHRWAASAPAGLLFAVLLVGGAAVPPPAAAQAPLQYVNANTTVRHVSFRFVDQQTFDTSRLKEQIATAAPGFFARLQNQFAFLPGLGRRDFLFDPVTLQKDVVRLRQFYQQNGFPSPSIDYPASQLDTTRNRIHVIFTVREGPALQIRDTEFLTADGTEVIDAVLPPSIRSAWQAYERREIQLSGRYTDFARTQLEDQIQSWLRNRGFAFAQVRSEASVDTTCNSLWIRGRKLPSPKSRWRATNPCTPASFAASCPFRWGIAFRPGT
jgi:outer membrane protein insertion porin family